MKRYISSTILALVIAGLPTVALAKGPNPLQGYISVWNNLAEKGANYGRCNAVGILGDALVMTTGTVPVLVPASLATDCADLGIELSESITEEDDGICLLPNGNVCPV
jgi:hypothetical protein